MSNAWLFGRNFLTSTFPVTSDKDSCWRLLNYKAKIMTRSHYIAEKRLGIITMTYNDNQIECSLTRKIPTLLTLCQEAACQLFINWGLRIQTYRHNHLQVTAHNCFCCKTSTFLANFSKKCKAMTLLLFIYFHLEKIGIYLAFVAITTLNLIRPFQ